MDEVQASSSVTAGNKILQSKPNILQSKPDNNKVESDDNDDSLDYENVTHISRVVQQKPTPTILPKPQKIEEQGKTFEEIQIEGKKIGRPIYMSRSAFTGGEENETNLKQGELVIVLDKLGNGFWHVHSHAGVGWVPSHFLRNPTELFDSAENKSQSNSVSENKNNPKKAPLFLPGPHTNRPPRKREVVKADTGFKNTPSVQPKNGDDNKSVSELRKMFAGGC